MSRRKCLFSKCSNLETKALVIKEIKGQTIIPNKRGFEIEIVKMYLTFLKIKIILKTENKTY